MYVVSILVSSSSSTRCSDARSTRLWYVSTRLSSLAELGETRPRIGFGDDLARGGHDVHEVAAERGVVRGVRNGNHREARFVERGVGSDGVALVPPQESDRAHQSARPKNTWQHTRFTGRPPPTTPREARER